MPCSFELSAPPSTVMIPPTPQLVKGTMAPPALIAPRGSDHTRRAPKTPRPRPDISSVSSAGNPDDTEARFSPTSFSSSEPSAAKNDQNIFSPASLPRKGKDSDYPVAPLSPPHPAKILNSLKSSMELIQTDGVSLNQAGQNANCEASPLERSYCVV